MEKRDRGELVTGSRRAFWEQLGSQLGSVIFIKGPLTCGLGGPPLLDVGDPAAGILLEVFPPGVSRLPLSSGDTYVTGSLRGDPRGPVVGVRLLLGVGPSACGSDEVL